MPSTRAPASDDDASLCAQLLEMRGALLHQIAILRSPPSNTIPGIYVDNSGLIAEHEQQLQEVEAALADLGEG
jgi:hypothetical protein